MNDIIKNYWNNRPCNVRHSNKDIGTKEYFEEVTKRKYFVEPHIPKFASFDKWSNKKVLEIGCGIGTDAISFLQNGADYYGIDISDESIKIAKKRLSLYNYDSNRLFCINAENLLDLFEQESFDLIYSFGVIHHMSDPIVVIDIIHKLLKKDAIFKLMLYSKESWKNYMIEVGLDQYEAQNGCPVANTYTEEEIRNLLHKFNILSIHKDHIFPYNVEEYKKYNYVLEKWFEYMDPLMFKQLEKKLGFHTLIEANK